MKKIALEEHFISPGLIEYWQPTMTDVPKPIYDKIYAALADFGEMRLSSMDGAGIEKAILSVSGPGVQVEPDAARATAKAAEARQSGRRASSLRATIRMESFGVTLAPALPG